MHFQKSSLLLLTTTALTSIAVASRPSSATPVIALNADVDIAQRGVNHKQTNEPLYSAMRGDLWADENYFKQDAPVVVVTHHGAYDVKDDIAKRAALSATTTEYNTKTMTTDVADLTAKPKEKVVESDQVKAKASADPQAQQVAEPLVDPYFAAPSEQIYSPLAHHGTAKTTKSPNKSKLTSLEPSPSTSTPTPPSGSQSTPLSNTVINLPPHESPPPQSYQSKTHTADLPKRSPGTFEYVYDTTTVLVTPTPPAQYGPNTGTKKLRFGVVAMSPTTKKAHS